MPGNIKWRECCAVQRPIYYFSVITRIRAEKQGEKNFDWSNFLLHSLFLSKSLSPAAFQPVIWHSVGWWKSGGRLCAVSLRAQPCGHLEVKPVLILRQDTLMHFRHLFYFHNDTGCRPLFILIKCKVTNKTELVTLPVTYWRWEGDRFHTGRFCFLLFLSGWQAEPNN